jgi:hypothetical protein
MMGSRIHPAAPKVKCTRVLFTRKAIELPLAIRAKMTALLTSGILLPSLEQFYSKKLFWRREP